MLVALILAVGLAQPACRAGGGWRSASAPASAKDDLDRAFNELLDYFHGRDVTVMVPLPAPGWSPIGLVLRPGVGFDQQEYADQLRSRGSNFPTPRKADRVNFLIQKKKGRILVGFFFSGYKGTILAIDFGRPLEPEDVRPEVVVQATSPLLEFEGVEPIDPPTGFDPEALLALLEETPAFGAPPPGPPPSGASTTAPPTPPAPPTVAHPDLAPGPIEPVLTVLSAEVEPVRTPPGEAIEILVHFEVGGLPPGRAVPITLEWQLFAGDKPLLPAQVTGTRDWGTGRHTNSESFVVPADAPPGFYRLRVVLRGAGREHVEEAFFQVQPASEE